MQTYAIGDIHGQLDMLRAAHARIAQDCALTGNKTAQVVHLGDLTDRGPDSRGVIQYLMDGIAAGEPWVVIKGNHDRMFSRFVRDGTIHDVAIKSGLSWLNSRLGGDKTLASYGVETTDEDVTPALLKATQSAVPEGHLQFLESLPLTHQDQNILFVHAGIRPGVALADQDEQDLIWIRDGWLDHTGPLPWLVVHGHTALDAPEHAGNRVNLDSGAGYFRPMTAAVFEGRDVWVLEEDGRRALTP